MKTENKTVGRVYAYCPASALRYAQVLYELHIPKEEIEKTKVIFTEVPQIRDVLVNPTIKTTEKMNVIDRIFPEKMRNFLKVACKNQRIGMIMDILDAYASYSDKQDKILHAELVCVEPPSEEQLKKMKAFLCSTYHMSEAQIRITQDRSLLGGFVLRTGDKEYDWSLKGRLTRLEQKLTWR